MYKNDYVRPLYGDSIFKVPGFVNILSGDGSRVVYADLLRLAYRFAEQRSRDPETWSAAVMIPNPFSTAHDRYSPILGTERLASGADKTGESPVYTHAERDAISLAKSLGVPFRGSVLVTPLVPCGDCAQDIATSGLEGVILHKQMIERIPDLLYEDRLRALDLLDKAGVDIFLYDGVVGGVKNKMRGEYWEP